MIACPVVTSKEWMKLIDDIKTEYSKFNFDDKKINELANIAFHVKGTGEIPTPKEALKILYDGSIGFTNRTIKDAFKNFFGEMTPEVQGAANVAAVNIESTRKEFVKKVSEFLKTNEKLRGKLSEKQIDAITRKASSIGISKTAFDRFTKYVDKVVTKQNYVEDVNKGKEAQKKMKPNEAFGVVKDTVKRMKSLDISRLSSEELTDFNNLANFYLETTKGYEKTFDKKQAESVLDRLEKSVKEDLDKETAEMIKETEANYGLTDLTEEEANLMNEYMDSEDQDTFIDGLDENSKEKLRSNLERTSTYSLIGLKERLDSITSKTASPKQRRTGKIFEQQVGKKNIEYLKEISKADVSLLTSEELAQLIKGVNNSIVNNSNNNITNIYASVKAAEGRNILLYSTALIPKTTLGGFAQLYYNLPVALKGIYGNAKAETAYRYYTGYDYVMNASAISHSLIYKKKEGYLDRYEKLLKNNKTEDSPENDVKCSIYAHLIDVRVGKENGDFLNNKKTLKESIEGYLNSEDKDVQKAGELANGIYEEVVDKFDNYSDFQNNFKTKYNGEHEAVTFFINMNKDNAKKYQEYASSARNIPIDLSERENFTHRFYKNLEGKVTQAESLDEQKRKQTTEQAFDTGRSKDRTLFGVLPEGKVLDLINFKYNMLTEHTDVLFEQEAYLGSKIFNKISGEGKGKENKARRADFEKLVGGKENAEFLIKDYNVSLNLLKYGKQATDNLGKIGVFQAAESIRAASSVVALAGGSQAVKQLTPGINTLVQNPIYFSKTFAISNKSLNNLPLLNLRTIGARGVEMAMISGAESSRKLSYSKTVNRFSKVGSILKESKAKFTELSLAALTNVDTNVAKRSFVSFYLEYMDKNGFPISLKDLPTEHLRMNDLREEALSYAQQKTDLTQAPSKKEMMSAIQKSSDTGLKIVQNVIMPFNNFASNNRARMLEDIRKLSLGNSSQKGEATMSIVSYAAETAVYSASKVILANTFYRYGLKQLLGYVFNIDVKDQDPAELLAKSFKNFYTTATREFMFSGFGGAAEGWGMDELNYAAFVTEKKILPFSETNKEYFDYLHKDPLFKPQYTPPKNGLGMVLNNTGGYGILFSEAIDAVSNGKAAYTGIAKDEYGFEKMTVTSGKQVDAYFSVTQDVKLTQEQREFYMWLSIVQGISLSSGLRDNDLMNAWKGMRYDIMKKDSKRGGGGKMPSAGKQSFGGMGKMPKM